ncbi:MAG TPA: GTPase HflX [Terriglobales bacterium]
MNSNSLARSRHNRRGEPERVFLVGVEFLSRNLVSRDKHQRSSESRSADVDGAPAAHPRQQPPGKVSASARAARSVAEPQLHAADAESHSFSAEESMAELRELALSAGASIAGELHQRRQRPDSATLIGSGKVEELNGAVASVAPDLVIFDYELTPSQQRNLERELHIRVIDRTQLILDIFARHARTREGQLQVELAQLEYMLPRLAGRGVEMSQLGGGIGTRGPGETQLETDRRKIYRRVRHVKEQLENVRRIRGQQRQRRESVPVPVIALVGYTNAGKSTLFNALTKAGVLESARMFATLDPTLRHIKLPSKREVLLSDTVGFIRHLPHTLVSAFRATLEEVQRATLLLQVADVTSPVADEQHAQVEEVLRELEANDRPRLVVMNKVDLLPEIKRESLIDSGDVVHVSAAKGTGMDRLLQRIDELIEQDPIQQARLRVPQSEGKALATLDAKAVVLSREYRDGNVELEVQAPESVLRNLKAFLCD